MSVITNINSGELYQYFVNDIKYYLRVIDNENYYTSKTLLNLETEQYKYKSNNLLLQMNTVPSIKLVTNLLLNSKSRFEMILEKTI
jgi:hypothetical protein